MIKHLKLRKYIFIRELDLDFYEGLNIFTGETGAGKSIILEAIQSLFHYRLTTDLIQEGESSAYLEGTFIISSELKQELKETLAIETDLEHQELIISREISKNNNKARINGRLVPVKILLELADYLVDLHGQGSSYKLLNQNFQLGLLDSYIGPKQQDLLKVFQKEFREFRTLEEELYLKKKEQQKTIEEQDYFKFKLEEIDKLALENTEEEEELKQEINQLSNREERNLLIEKLESFGRSEESFFPEIQTNLENLKKSGETELKKIIDQALEKLESLIAFLKELRYFKLEQLETSKIDDLNARLSQIQKLKKKYRVTSIKELLLLKQELENKVHNSDFLEKEIKKLESKTNRLKETLLEKAKVISQARKENSIEFSKQVTKELRKLAFQGIEFKTILKENSELALQGLDQLDFQSRNEKDGEFRSLKKTASGGELSRISLTLKSLRSSRREKEQVVIFDEIDAGTSGEVSWLIGEKLSRSSLKEQIICITHQPLVACYADFYFLVSKEVKNRVNIRVEMLKEQKEILEALSALLVTKEKNNQTAQQYLKEIIQQAKNFKASLIA